MGGGYKLPEERHDKEREECEVLREIHNEINGKSDRAMGETQDHSRADEG